MIDRGIRAGARIGGTNLWVLFFAGISSKMDTMRARVLLTSLAVIVLIAGIALAATMPVEI